MHRVENGKPFLFPDDPRIVALASDAPPPFGPPRVQLDNVEAIAALGVAHAMPAEEAIRRLRAAEAPPPTGTAQ